MEQPSSTSRRLLGIVLLAILTGVVFAIRLTAPSDLLGNDQLRPAAYALDVVLHGRWVVQTDYGGDVASKPPFSTWLVAGISLAAGGVTLVTLYLPSALSVWMSSVLAFAWGRRFFGELPAFLAGATIVLSAYGFKHVALARTDAVFMGMVCLTAFLTLRAWQIGVDPASSPSKRTNAWTLAWVAAALATLTKGPLGLVLGATGLFAIFWERRGGAKQRHRGHHWLGAAIFLALCGGWFVAAYATAGDAFIDKVIGRELVGHVVGASKEHLPKMSLSERIGAFVIGLGKPTAYIASRFLPWSIPAVLGLWRVWRRPSESNDERQFERFITCWLVGGVALFSVMPHQRADLLLPLMPAAALLGGREIAVWLIALQRSARIAVAAVVALIALGGGVYEYHVRAVKLTDVRRTAAVSEATTAIAEFREKRPEVQIIDLDASGGMQFFLGMKEPRVKQDDAIAALTGERPVVVLTRDPAALIEVSGSKARVVCDVKAREGFRAGAVTNVPSEQ